MAESTAAPVLRRELGLFGAIVLGLASLGDVKTTWSFSAFTVLIYYAITNLATLKMPPEERLYPRVCAWLALAACLFLAFWVEWQVWLSGLGLLGVGLMWFGVVGRQTVKGNA